MGRSADDDPSDGLVGRLMSAVVTLTFAAPVCLLLFLVLNRMLSTGPMFSWKALGWSVGSIAAFGFLFPRTAPDLVGKMWEILMEIGR